MQQEPPARYTVEVVQVVEGHGTYVHFQGRSYFLCDSDLNQYCETPVSRAQPVPFLRALLSALYNVEQAPDEGTPMGSRKVAPEELERDHEALLNEVLSVEHPDDDAPVFGER